MAASKNRGRMAAVSAGLLRATALACLLAAAGGAGSACAQDLGALAGDGGAAPSNAQLLLEADRLTYDNDKDVVTASGGVRIEYNGTRLVADTVVYDRKSGRLKANGGVQIIDREGTRVFSNQIDITEDFGEGFVNALRVETIEKTYVAAESAKREGGRLTTFFNGVYTACAPCEEHPGRPPIWRIKARRVIWNGETKTIRFEHSRFELFGLPIAYFPVAEVPDPSVKRKSGFLIPGLEFDDELGTGVTVPYYFALSPTFDLTTTGTYYANQGFLGQAQFRQRFNNGQYTLTVAGINQADPSKFDAGTIDGLTSDGDLREKRGMIGSQGRFAINPRWAFGWDVMAQSDKNFSRTYGIDDYSDLVRLNQVYLFGLNDRNYFDLRGIKFDIQEETPDINPGSRDKDQPFVLPTFDYSFTPDEPVYGGELNFTVNARALSRSRLDATRFTDNDIEDDDDPRIRGIEGNDGRVTAEAEWKRSIITDSGVVVTPLLAFQTDASYSDISDGSAARLDLMAAQLNASSDYTGIPVEGEVDSAFARAMATLGMELRWPVLFSFTSGTHILEPMAQVFARPSEGHLGELGIPNEDAQSFVFDASTLFERDKFSGYDRIEGGTRANVGLRYSGAYDNGWTTNAILGQSYHLAGENSFDAPDLLNVGAYSGLETDTSDFVALAGFITPTNIAVSASGRFDEQTFELRRGEVKAAYPTNFVSLTGRYTFIQAQPLYGFTDDRQEVTGGASVKLSDTLRAFTTATYDLQNEGLASTAYGVSYSDECFGLVLTYANSRNVITGLERPSIALNVTFRTIGTFGSSTSAVTDVLGE